MAFNKRLYKCLWRDKVDLLFWLAIAFFFGLSQVEGKDVSGLLVVVFFYVYNVMIRLNHYWQDRAKMHRHLESIGENIDAILGQDDI
jgi:hypothetical protein